MAPPDLQLPTDQKMHFTGSENSTSRKIQVEIPSNTAKSRSKKSKPTTNSAEFSLSIEEDNNYLYALRNKVIYGVPPEPPSTSKSKLKAKQSNKRKTPTESSIKQENSSPEPISNQSSPEGKNIKRVRVRNSVVEEDIDVHTERKPKVHFDLPEDKVNPVIQPFHDNSTPNIDKIVAQSSKSITLPKRKTIITNQNSTIDKYSFEKLKDLINVIFEAQDSIMISNEQNIDKDYQIHIKQIDDKVYLRYNTIKNLSLNLNQLFSSKPNSILGLASNEYEGTGQPEIVNVLGRLIKLLNNNVEYGNQILVWSFDKVDKETIEECASRFEIATETMMAINCIFSILQFDQLPKQVYFEDVISNCLSGLRFHLTKNIYQYVESIEEGYNNPSELLAYVARNNINKVLHSHLSELFNSIIGTLPSLNTLMSLKSISLSEQVLITTAYIAINPFFVAEPSITKSNRNQNNLNLKNALLPIGKDNGMRALRLIALTLIQNIFANYENQRNWIIDEIISSIIKLPDIKKQVRKYQLRSGETIFTFSALILQLVQISSHNFYNEIEKFRNKRYLDFENNRENDNINFIKGELNVWLNNGIESSSVKVAQSIIMQIFSNLNNNKINKSSHEADYKIILENLINDSLKVLYQPEWPSSSLILIVIFKCFAKFLDDQRNTPEIMNLKQVSLEHLGNILSKLREVDKKINIENDNKNNIKLKSIEDIVKECDKLSIENLNEKYQKLLMKLHSKSNDDEIFNSAFKLNGVIYGQSLIKGLKLSQELIESYESSESELKNGQIEIQNKIIEYLTQIWIHDNESDQIDDDELLNGIENDSLSLSCNQILQSLQDHMLCRILMYFNVPSPTLRSKAVKCLGNAVIADPSLLKNNLIKVYIENRVTDVSSSVRDSAIDIISKYILVLPNIMEQYFDVISSCISDPSVAVRKRVIKLLQLMYNNSNDDNYELQAKICKHLCLHIGDEDELIKENLLQGLDELWFNEKGNALKRYESDEESDNDNESREKDEEIVTVIMKVAQMFNDRYDILQNAFEKVSVTQRMDESNSFIN